MSNHRMNCDRIGLIYALDYARDRVIDHTERPGPRDAGGFWDELSEVTWFTDGTAVAFGEYTCQWYGEHDAEILLLTPEAEQ